MPALNLSNILPTYKPHPEKHRPFDPWMLAALNHGIVHLCGYVAGSRVAGGCDDELAGSDHL